MKNQADRKLKDRGVVKQHCGWGGFAILVWVGGRRKILGP